MCARAGFFFFNDTATTEIYTLSLHDALPICVLLLTGHPLENPLALKLDGEGIGKIDDPFARVFHGADGEEALRRIVDAGGSPLRTSPRTVDSEAALRAGPAHSPIEIH